MSRAGKTFFITGGCSGLGLALATKLHNEGANICIADLNDEEGQKIQQSFGDRCLFQKTNVTIEKEVGAAVAATVAKFKTLSGCINCAGIGSATTTVSRKNEPMDSRIFDFIMQINIYGTFYGSAHCAAAMAKLPAEADGSRGIIVNIASVAGIEGQKGQVPYSASKGAVIGMTLPMARDLARFGIRVMTVAPGIINTPLMMSSSEKVQKNLLSQVVYPKRFGEPSEFAHLVAAIIDNKYMNAEVIRFDAGIRFANL